MLGQRLGGMVPFTGSRAVQTKWARAQDGLHLTFAVSVFTSITQVRLLLVGSQPGCCTLPSELVFARSS